MSKPVQYHEGKFPPSDLNWSQLIPLIGPANAAVARYDGKLSSVPNAALLLSPLTTQEAVLSSRIEGTQTTIGEVLEFEAKGDTDDLTSKREADIWEVINYRKAMHTAVKMLDEFPLSQRIIREAHRILLRSVRGHSKSPGNYRKTPNWIGPPGCTVDNARFVPISADKLPKAMSLWERYIHENVLDRLTQLAILHAEFEALHPFLDGNGRLGRMCVPLFMHSQKIISGPMFYISAFFESNRDEYYERLLAVSRDGDWTGWCAFFLKAIIAQSEKNLQIATAILDLYNDMKNRFVDLTHSQYAIHALDWMFEHPIFKSSDFVRSSQIHRPTAARILSILKEEGILGIIEESRGRKASILAYRELLNITEGYDLF